MSKKKDQPISKPGLLTVSFELNGKPVTCDIRPAAVMLDVLRDQMQLKGTKPGCNEGECGACSILVNDAPVNSCLMPAVNALGKKITTIEGLTQENGRPGDVQQLLVQNGAVQCGFCTSGMAVTIKAMQIQAGKQRKVPGAAGSSKSRREAVMKYLEGNLCRCTGYVKIIDAAEQAIAQNSKA